MEYESRFLDSVERIARAFERIADNLEQVTETPVGQVRALVVSGVSESAGISAVETPL